MLSINGIEYDVTIVEILETLRDESPLDILRHIRDLGDNVQCTCPFHGEGQENHPSFGVSTVDKYRGQKLIPAGTCHCFTCGETMALDEFISRLFLKQDGGRFGNKWLRNHYSNILVGKKRKFDLTFKGREGDSTVYIDEDVLDNYRYFHPYMYKRGLTDEIIELFDIGYDAETTSITMPVHDLHGRVPFIQRRSVYKKFHNYAEGVEKTNYVYGAYELLKYYPNKHEEVWICESILNCLTCWKYNIPAVALMGVGGGKQYEILRKLPYRRYVFALDPDGAGQKAQWNLYKELKHTKHIARLIYKNTKEDINDLQEKILDLQIEDYQ